MFHFQALKTTIFIIKLDRQWKDGYSSRNETSMEEYFKRNILTFFKRKVAVFVTEQNDPYMHPFVNILVVVANLWQYHKSLF